MWHCEGLHVIVISIAHSLNEWDRVQANDILDCKKWWTQCFAREEWRSKRSPSSVWLDASHPYLCFANWYYEHKYKWYKNIYFQQHHLGNFFEGPSPVDNLFLVAQAFWLWVFCLAVLFTVFTSISISMLSTSSSCWEWLCIGGSRTLASDWSCWDEPVAMSSFWPLHMTTSLPLGVASHQC